MRKLQVHTTINKNNSGKAKFAAWLFLALVLLTVVPFNLLHHHQESVPLHKWEALQLDSINSNLLAVEIYGQCDHEIHIAREQQMCLLCHFAFAPAAPTTSLSLSSVLITPVVMRYSDSYQNHFTSQLIGVALNKGPPTKVKKSA